MLSCFDVSIVQLRDGSNDSKSKSKSSDHKMSDADSKSSSKSGGSKMDIDSSDDISSLPTAARFAAVGSWNREEGVRILSLPALTQLATIRIEADTIPRSVLLTQFAAASSTASNSNGSSSTSAAAASVPSAHLFIGLGDGHLMTSTITPPPASSGAATQHSSILGTIPHALPLVVSAPLTC